MATKIIYEPQYTISGWPDDSGMAPISWFDRDLSSTTIITLASLYPGLVTNVNQIFVPQPLTVQILPSLFVNLNVFFHPTSVRALGAPDQAIKNEVRRVR